MVQKSFYMRSVLVIQRNFVRYSYTSYTYIRKTFVTSFKVKHIKL